MTVPYLDRSAPWFVFLANPRHPDDLDRMSGAAFLRRYSSSEAEFRTKAYALAPLILGECLFGFSAVRGELVAVGFLPEEMIGVRAKQAVASGIELAVERGTKVIGLGAQTASATGGGQLLLPYVPAGVTLTNGNAYTAAVVRSNVVEASKRLGLGSRATVAVIGCTGSVGVPTCHLLAEAGFRLILVGRMVERVRLLLGGLSQQALLTDSLAAARGADIIVLLTGDPSIPCRLEQTRPGTVIIDCAQPVCLSAPVRQAFRHRGVVVTPGGIVSIPGYTSTYDFGLPKRGDAFACLAETYLVAREGIREHSVGRPSVAFARRLERAALRHHVRPGCLDLAVEAR